MYCMYLRKSRADTEAEAHGEGETLARHEHVLLELAKRQKLNVIKIYREIVSGETIASRPVMQQLLGAVEQGCYSGVLVVEVERLARGDTMDQGLVAQTFKYSDTKIITPMKVYDPGNEFDEEYFEFGLFMSRREYKTINRRMQRGRLQSVEEGKYCGNKPPYGYTRVKLPNQKGYTLEPHPEQSQVVQMIYSLYTTGTGMSLIVRKLNDIKVPTITGGDWVLATIRGILSNPVYTGKIRWNFRPQVKKMIGGEMVRERPRAKSSEWAIFDGLHPAIIGQDIFDTAQRILAENHSVPAPKNRGVKNPLAGLIICGKCGRRMIRRPYGGKYPDTLMCPVTSCNNVSSLLSLVEDRLLQALAIWLDRYEVTAGVGENSDTEAELIGKAIATLEDEIATLDKQMCSLHDLLEQGVYSTETFLSRSQVLGDKMRQVKADEVKLNDGLKEIHANNKGRADIVPAVKKVLDIYHDLQTAEYKNKLLKEVLDKVVYTKELSGRWHGKPDDFELVLYPKLPK